MLLSRYIDDDLRECGCDEAGRGCLAGPVYAAAVILPADFSHPLLNDSKQLSEKQRYTLRPVIESEAIAWGIGIVSVQEIDEINILRASFLAMHRAIEQLPFLPERLLIDGNRFDPFEQIPHHCIVGGDARYRSIAAASILAKTYRDDAMLRLNKDFPMYGWERNKGYPSTAHKSAIRRFGVSPHHRLTFRGVADADRPAAE